MFCDCNLISLLKAAKRWQQKDQKQLMERWTMLRKNTPFVFRCLVVVVSSLAWDAMILPNAYLICMEAATITLNVQSYRTFFFRISKAQLHSEYSLKVTDIAVILTLVVKLHTLKIITVLMIRLITTLSMKVQVAWKSLKINLKGYFYLTLQ